MERMQILYENFLDCGYTPQLFYQLSVNEAIDMINSYNRRKDKEQKEELQKLISILDLFGSNLIEKVVMSIGKAEDEFHFSMLEYFPELFPQAKKPHDEYIQEDEKTAPTLSKDMQLYKAQRIQHAYRVNQQRHKQQKE